MRKLTVDIILYKIEESNYNVIILIKTVYSYLNLKKKIRSMVITEAAEMTSERMPFKVVSIFVLQKCKELTRSVFGEV